MRRSCARRATESPQAPGARNRDGARIPLPRAGSTRSVRLASGLASERLPSTVDAERSEPVAPAAAAPVTAGRKRDGAGRPAGTAGVPEVRYPVGSAPGESETASSGLEWALEVLDGVSGAFSTSWISARTVSWILRSSRMPWPTCRPTSGSRFGPNTMSATMATTRISRGPSWGIRRFLSDRESGPSARLPVVGVRPGAGVTQARQPFSQAISLGIDRDPQRDEGRLGGAERPEEMVDLVAKPC